jgi:hypothetical protein
LVLASCAPAKLAGGGGDPTNGASGPTGVTAINGSTGGTGPSGTTGATTGPTGNSATTGPSGMTGVSGTSGVSGFAWPLGGTDSVAWVINNYVDLDPTAGILDYKGGDKTYDGHLGVDIDLPGFRAMDQGVDILAAAAGVVETVVSGFPDRHYACVNNDWNVVTVRHSNGTLAFYGHMQTASAVVSVGQSVVAGQKLGHVGSSGCSTTAHLHFELHDQADAVIDPFLALLWAAPPRYDTVLNVMDSCLIDGGITSVDQIKDPGADATSVLNGHTLGVGLSVAGGASGDSVGVDFVRPDASTAWNGSETFTQTYRHSFWYWNYVVPNTPGTWTIVVRKNGAVQAQKTITVF